MRVISCFLAGQVLLCTLSAIRAFADDQQPATRPASTASAAAAADYALAMKHLLGVDAPKDRARTMQLLAKAAAAGEDRAATLMNKARELGAAPDYRPGRNARILSGHNLKPEESRALEAHLKDSPNDVAARLVLIDHYERAARGIRPTFRVPATRPAEPSTAPVETAAARAALLQHHEWLIAHCPDAPFMPVRRLGNLAGPWGFSQAPELPAEMEAPLVEAWKKAAAAQPRDAAVLGNAGHALFWSDRAAGAKLYRDAIAREPEQHLWRKRLLLDVQGAIGPARRGLWMADDDERRTLAANLLESVEQLAGDALAATGPKPEAAAAPAAEAPAARWPIAPEPTESYMRTDLVRVLAMSAAELGDAEKAGPAVAILRKLADDTEIEAAARSLAGHYAHIAAGRMALRRGDIDGAAAAIVAATKSPPPAEPRPGFSLLTPPGGPSWDLSLARDLLRHGRRDEVLNYLKACQDAGANEPMAAYERLIRAGKVPFFGSRAGY